MTVTLARAVGRTVGDKERERKKGGGGVKENIEEKVVIKKGKGDKEQREDAEETGAGGLERWRRGHETHRHKKIR